VDPVAVLATFTEIHVNDMLYIVVFGESLLNDAVSVVLYRMFDAFARIGQENLIPLDIVLGCLSFFVVALGGVLIGIIFGVVACFTTKFTEHTPVLEPLIILVYAYLSYLTSEMVSVSGILAITFCGMVMKQYVSFNISKKSDATTEYVLKMLSSIMETIIFMFMGLSTVSDHHSWNTGFVLITLLACLVFRVIGIAIFANIANCWRLLELTRIDMLIMSYGGLRGAIAFALALILDENKIPRKKEFVTATIAVVFFTVFIQGITIGPLVKLLNVRRKQIEEPTMSAKLTNRMMDHVMTCLEEISGSGGSNSLRDKCRNLDRNYFKRWLLRETPQEKMDIKLLQTFKKINMQSAMKLHDTSKGLVPPVHPSPSSASLKPESTYANMSQLFAANLQHEQTVPDLMLFEAQQSEQQLDDAKMHHFLDANMFIARPRAPIHLRSKDESRPRLVVPADRSDRFDRQLHHRSHLYMPPKLETTKEHKRSKTGKLAKIITPQQANNDKRKRSLPTPSPTLLSKTSHQHRQQTKTPLETQPLAQGRRNSSPSPQPSPLMTQTQQQPVQQHSRISEMKPPPVIKIDNEEQSGSTAAERMFPWRSSIDSTGIPLRLDDHPSDQPLIASAFGSYTSPEYFNYATTTKPEDHTQKPSVKNLFDVNEQEGTSDDGNSSHQSTDVEIRTSSPTARNEAHGEKRTTTRL
ncbi:unnamed protein product, partial [Didymodactylos carnosus]